MEIIFVFVFKLKFDHFIDFNIFSISANDATLTDSEFNKALVPPGYKQ